MEELLFLVHRIPYPPNKGDKIRSFHLLEHLARRYQVHLGTFVDDPADWAQVEAVRAFCAETCILRLRPGAAKLGSLAGFWRGEALTLPYYRSRALQRWVDGLLARRPVRRVLAFSSAMAQYVHGPAYRSLRRVIDFVDVDSDKWLQYSRSKSWPMSWIYRREGRRLLAFERSVAAEFAASVFVTAPEAELFNRLAPQAAVRTFAVGNGVDTEFFDPERPYPNPYPEAAAVLVFTGAMDYWANVDAVCWFARRVFPQVYQAQPAARFYIVGARPDPQVQQLAAQPGVHIAGAVPDVRPYLAHARAAVAPLRIGRGVQNKVLEALAMAKPVIATSMAMDGIVACPALAHRVSDEPERLAATAVSLLKEGDPQGLGALGRAWVLRHYRWSENLSRIEHLLEGSAGPTQIHPEPVYCGAPL